MCRAGGYSMPVDEKEWVCPWFISAVKDQCGGFIGGELKCPPFAPAVNSVEGWLENCFCVCRESCLGINGDIVGE